MNLVLFKSIRARIDHFKLMSIIILKKILCYRIVSVSGLGITLNRSKTTTARATQAVKRWQKYTMTSWCASENDFCRPTQTWHATYKYTSAFTPFVSYLTNCSFTIRYNSQRVTQDFLSKSTAAILSIYTNAPERTEYLWDYVWS